MEQLEVEKLVGELELGVDRLRSLYEQYFMGIEKLEPTVPRKDVDRRIHVLRKEQIRNTALRFRFLMILQRYNTYQSHWQRICREIENGTFKRHMMRAQRRFEGSRSSAPPPAPAARTWLPADQCPPGHHGLAGTPAQGSGMLGSPRGSGLRMTVPFGLGYVDPGGHGARPASHSTSGNRSPPGLAAVVVIPQTR